jgi:hypothetical protein
MGSNVTLLKGEKPVLFPLKLANRLVLKKRAARAASHSAPDGIHTHVDHWLDPYSNECIKTHPSIGDLMSQASAFYVSLEHEYTPGGPGRED